MSATVIGRVSVKVSPDTSDFRSETQRELSAIEKATDDFKIGFEADISEAISEVRRAVNAAKSKAQDSIKLRLDLGDTNSLQRGLKQVERQLDSLKVTTLDVDLNRDDLRAAKDLLEDELSKAKAQPVVALSDPSVRTAQARLGALARTRVVDFVPKVNEAAAAKVGASLLALSGARGLTNIGSDLAEFIGGLDKSIPKITGAGLAVADLGSLSLSAVSNLLTLGGSLASIVPAALALPGVFGGVALGMGATVAVLKDFGDVLPGVGAQFSELQDSMSERFWATAKAPVREFIDVLFPQFASGMEATSGALGGFFADLARSTTGQFNGQLGSMFDDLAESIDIAGDYGDNFAGIIQKLGAVGAGQLPSLARYVGEVAAGFDGWLADTGRAELEQFIAQGIDALQDLGGTVKATASIFGGLATAAEQAGGSTLATLRSTTEGIAETVNSAKFQGALVGVFEASHDAIDSITNGAGKQFNSFMYRLADTLETVLPSAGRATGEALGSIFDALDQPSVQKAAVDLFADLETVISNLSGSMPGVADAFAGVIDVVGDIGVGLSKALGTALEDLAPAAADLADDLGPLVDQLGKFLVNAVEVAAPAVAGLAGHVGNLAGFVADALAPVNTFIDLLQELPAPVTGALGTLGSLGLLVGGSGWLGAAAAGKISTLGNQLTALSGKAGIASGAVGTVGITAGRIGQRLGSAGGITALTAGIASIATTADSSNGAVKALGSVAGGALTGFALAGPIGGAIGAGAGALLALSQNASTAGAAAEASKAQWDGLRDTLNQVTGATTATSRGLIYDELLRSGALEALEREGLTRRTVVDAVAGETAARSKALTVLDQERAQYSATAGEIAKLESAYLDAQEAYQGGDQGALGRSEDILANVDALKSENSSRRTAIDLLDETINGVKAETEAARERGKAITDYSNLVGKVPRKVITEIEQNGAPSALAGVRKLANQYRLTPRGIRTLIETAGIPASDKQIRALIGRLRDAGKLKTRPKIEVETRTAEGDTASVKRSVEQLDNVKGVSKVEIADKATRPIKAVQRELTVIARTTVSATVKVSDLASGVINGIRSNLRSLDGDNATVTTYHRSVYTVSRQGGGSAPRQGPVTPRTVPGMTPKVLEGLLPSPKVAATAGAKAGKAYRKNFEKTLTKLQNSVTNSYKKLLGAADSKKERGQFEKRFKKQVQQLNTLARLHTKLENELDKNLVRTKEIREELAAFRSQVIDTIVAASNPINFEIQTGAGIKTSMEDAVARAKEFASILGQLRGSGLNATTMQQILAAGPDAGLKTAKAILEAGVSEFNRLQAELEKVASEVATDSQMYLFKEQLAELKKLEKRAEVLEVRLGNIQSAIEKLGDRLVNALAQANAAEAGRASSAGSGKAGGGGTKKLPQAEPFPTKGRRVVPASTAAARTATGDTKIVNYYAPAGSKSLTSEEQLFSAMGRGRAEF